MKLAIMQPYFFPYIGYWQLIHEADIFILLDDVQFIRHGWLNRNRILKHGGGWQYITVPLRKYSKNELIKNIQIHNERDWKTQIMRQLAHYGFNKKNKANYYNDIIELLKIIFSKIQNDRLIDINTIIVKEICGFLNISTQVLIASQQGFDYTTVNDAGEWALRISEQMNAHEYINPIGGVDIFDPKKFLKSDIKLSFLKSNNISYTQGEIFEPWLSIIDVLMFNGKSNTQNILNKYSIIKVQ